MSFVVSGNIWMDVVAAIVVGTTVWYLSYPRKEDHSMIKDIPWAPEKLPIIGHALAYRKDPANFLLRSFQEVGGIFQLNMAGKHMIIIAEMDAQKQTSMAPERILSARQAVADLGFEETLGLLNVYSGTDLHKGIVKGIWHKDPQSQMEQWRTSIRTSLQIETKDDGNHHSHTFDFFQFIRRVILRSCIDRMISPKFLDDGMSNFLDEFMEFQDELEDVTAKAVVLPKWIARPALLLPVKRKRLQLQAKITKRLDELFLLQAKTPSSSSSVLGFWLEEFHTSKQHSTKEIAEYMVGILFAAHKNPAIGTCQMYLVMFERCTEKERQQIRMEANNLVLDSSSQFWNDKTTVLYKLCMETLRLTAHSIGAVRTVKEAFEVQSCGRSYTLPVGASIGMTHVTLGLQPTLWGENAERFDLTGHSLDMYQDEYRFSTFSNGLHKCPGQPLAVVILQLTVSLLLVEYDILLPSVLPPLSFERATLAQREKPVMVKVVGKE